MKFISGFTNVFFGVIVLLLGILIGCTLIGIPFALPVAASGMALMTKGMAQMGMGTYDAAKAIRNKSDINVLVLAALAAGAMVTLSDPAEASDWKITDENRAATVADGNTLKVLCNDGAGGFMKPSIWFQVVKPDGTSVPVDDSPVLIDVYASIARTARVVNIRTLGSSAQYDTAGLLPELRAGTHLTITYTNSGSAYSFSLDGSAATLDACFAGL